MFLCDEKPNDGIKNCFLQYVWIVDFLATFAIDRYMVDKRRVLFMFKDGSQAWEAKDFLVEQQEVKECSIENKIYHGHFTPEVSLIIKYCRLYICR